MHPQFRCGVLRASPQNSFDVLNAVARQSRSCQTNMKDGIIEERGTLTPGPRNQNGCKRCETSTERDNRGPFFFGCLQPHLRTLEREVFRKQSNFVCVSWRSQPALTTHPHLHYVIGTSCKELLWVCACCMTIGSTKCRTIDCMGCCNWLFGSDVMCHWECYLSLAVPP